MPVMEKLFDDESHFLLTLTDSLRRAALGESLSDD